MGVGKTTALVEMIKSGSETLEKPVDELVIVYTQPQAAYMEMAAVVPLVKLFRLGQSLQLNEFTQLLGDDKSKTRAIIFDDVRRNMFSRDML